MGKRRRAHEVGESTKEKLPVCKSVDKLFQRYIRLRSAKRGGLKKKKMGDAKFLPIFEWVLEAKLTLMNLKGIKASEKAR